MYLPEREAIEMANVALLLRRPLLVTGKPGTGKSSLARSIAQELKLGPLLYWPVTSRSRLQEALYRYDAIGRLQDASLARANGAAAVPEIGKFIQLGPLGTALVARDKPRVLLIDELDKSDIDLPNDLLNVFEEGKFPMPELSRQSEDGIARVLTADPNGWADVEHGMVECRAFPIVVITSNGEREFPPAFLRRCVRVTIPPPDARKLARIVANQLGDAALQDSTDVLELFTRRREVVDLATDQLLNAAYLTMSGLQPDSEERLRMVKRLFHDLGPSTGS
jgi:MoxR-like ATPase